MKVEVCYAEPDRSWRVVLQFTEPATVSDAIARSALIEQLGLDRSGLRFAVFGKLVALDAMLADRDRVELLRALVVDPKEARRRRAQKRAAMKAPRHSGAGRKSIG